MKYELKLLDDNSIKQSEDTKVLTDAIVEYKKILNFLYAMEEISNNKLFFKLMKICYQEVEEENHVENDEEYYERRFINLTDNYYLDDKAYTQFVIKNDDVLTQIRNKHFSKERLESDIQLVSSILSQYNLLLTDMIRKKFEEKRLIK